jgi:hypothetical protein
MSAPRTLLYMHDTIETFARGTDVLQAEWVANVQHQLHANSVRTVQRAAASLFGEVTDSIRTASRIVQSRNLTPEAIRETCNSGFATDFPKGREKSAALNEPVRLRVPSARTGSISF